MLTARSLPVFDRLQNLEGKRREIRRTEWFLLLPAARVRRLRHSVPPTRFETLPLGHVCHRDRHREDAQPVTGRRRDQLRHSTVWCGVWVRFFVLAPLTSGSQKLGASLELGSLSIPCTKRSACRDPGVLAVGFG